MCTTAKPGKQLHVCEHGPLERVVAPPYGGCYVAVTQEAALRGGLWDQPYYADKWSGGKSGMGGYVQAGEQAAGCEGERHLLFQPSLSSWSEASRWTLHPVGARADVLT